MAGQGDGVRAARAEARAGEEIPDGLRSREAEIGGEVHTDRARIAGVGWIEDVVEHDVVAAVAARLRIPLPVMIGHVVIRRLVRRLVAVDHPIVLQRLEVGRVDICEVAS